MTLQDKDVQERLGGTFLSSMARAHEVDIRNVLPGYTYSYE